MTKPVIVTRAGKGLALDYTELDANFTNLRDSTINFTGDAGDTRSMDLNDTTDFEGQKNIKITVDEATQKIYVKNTLSDFASDPIGFENLTDASISFNTSTRVFTIQPTTSSYNYWWKGKQVTVTTSKTVTIPNTTGQYLVYFNDETLSYKSGEPDWGADVPVSYIYWNADVGQGMFSKELHTISMDWKTKEYLHETQTAAYADGLTISNYTTTGTGALNADAQFDISNGVIYDQDIAVTITHSNTPSANSWQQDLQGPARIPVVYHSSSTGSWVMDSARDYAVKNGTSLVTYNLNTAGTWTTPDVTTTHFVAYWIVATNFLNTPIISIMGQRHDNKLIDADVNNTWASLDLTNFPAEEFRPLYRIIFRTATGYANTPKAYIAQVDDFRFSTIIPQGGSAVSVNNITEGDTNVTVTDTGTGLISMTVDGTQMATVTTSLLDFKEGIAAKRGFFPLLNYQADNGGNITVPTGSSFTVDLEANAQGVSGYQAVWDVINVNSTCTVNLDLGSQSIHQRELIFINNGITTKTLTLSIQTYSGQFLRVFYSDGTHQGTGPYTKSFTLDGGKIIWLQIVKLTDLSAGSSAYYHMGYIDIKLNNVTLP